MKITTKKIVNFNGNVIKSLVENCIIILEKFYKQRKEFNILLKYFLFNFFHRQTNQFSEAILQQNVPAKFTRYVNDTN